MTRPKNSQNIYDNRNELMYCVAIPLLHYYYPKVVVEEVVSDNCKVAYLEVCSCHRVIKRVGAESAK